MLTLWDYSGSIKTWEDFGLMGCQPEKMEKL